MKNTMNDKYLSSGSLALIEKQYFDKIANQQRIDSKLPVCGNCVSYTWGKDFENNYDRHCGSCYFQSKINYTVSQIFKIGDLHGLNNASSCDNFFNFRIKEK